MTGTYGVHEFLLAAESHRLRLQELLEQLDRVISNHGQRTVRVRAQWQAARQRLAELYLPDFSRETLARAARRTGFSYLAGETPYTRRDEEASSIRRRLEALAEDERILHPNRFIHPDAGLFTRQLLEARGFLETWQPAYDRFAQDETFMRLYNTGYGTSKYLPRWYSVVYYRDWRDADELFLAAGKNSWDELVEEFKAARDHRNRWRQAVEEALARIQEVHALARELEEKTERLEHLDHYHLEETRERLLKHLDGLAPAVLSGLAGDPTIEAQLAQVSGLAAKIEYLDGLLDYRLTPDLGSLNKALAKLERDIQKMKRPKKAGTRFTEQEFSERFKNPRPRYASRWTRIEGASDTLEQFDAYDRGRSATEILWWDVMTDGRIDGRFLPQVQDYHARHPGYHYVRPRRDDTRDAAVAAVLLEQDEPGTAWGDAS